MTIIVKVSTGLCGSENTTSFEIPDDEVSGMSESERFDYLEEMAKDAMFDMIDWNWHIATEGSR